MRVEIHRLDDNGNSELVGNYTLYGTQVLTSPHGQETLERVLRTAAVKNPETGKWLNAYDHAAEWLTWLHTHLRTPYLSASPAVE
jgi:hypothetical protein